MRIWLINVGEEIPSDPGPPRLLRTGILAQHLAERGHEVVWWNASVNHQRHQQRVAASEVRETPQGYKLVLLYGRLYRANHSLTRILSQIENGREFRRMAPALPVPEVVVAGYPTIELAKAAVDFAVPRAIPVAVDFRDLWPDVIEDHLPAPVRALARPIISRWRKDQRDIVAGATAIIGITDAFVDWALAAAGRPRTSLDRAFHLAVDPTAPTGEQLVAAERSWDELDIRPGRERAVGCFMGGLARRGELLTLLEAAASLDADDAARLRLVICGPDELMREIRERLGDRPPLLLAGWRHAAEIQALLRRSHFGMLPYPSSADFRMSYPNKVGEYLSAGLPVMTSLSGLTRRMLEERGLGLLYDEGDGAGARQCLRKAIRSTAELSALAPVARRAFEELFDGRRIYPAFCDFVEELGRVRRPQD